MKLKKILKNIDVIQIKGSKEIEITGVFSHSKVVFPGSIFIAKSGTKTHGNQYIQNAIANGASCVVSDMYNPFLTTVTQVIVDDPASVEAVIAKNFFEDPANSLSMIGITATAGKTTTSYYVKHLLEGDSKVGLIGTIETYTGLKTFKSSHTTPDSPTLMKILKEMKVGKCDSCVMEVSSHALDQGRVDEIGFDVTAFLNISEEHLDYHGTMAEYKDAKEQLLMHRKKDGIVVVPYKDAWGRSIKKKIPEAITYGYSKKADVYAFNIVMTTKGSTFDLYVGGEKRAVAIKAIGEFNIDNVLAAVAIAYSLGTAFADIEKRLLTLPSISGRMERILNSHGLDLFVDYAHKVDALERVLYTIKKLYRKKCIIVFGCGGERDALKRPKMGSLVEKYCKYACITNDNPRGEDPKKIISDICRGIKRLEYKIIEDRKDAIEHALSIAEEGDVVLLAGKGHEEEQEILGRRYELSDRKLARDIMSVL